MLNRIQTFSNMPAPLKIGLLVASGAGITTVISYLFPGPLLYVIFGGLAVVVCLLLLYWRIVKFFRKRKSAPLERGLKENTSATPQEISETTRMARLDDLRKKFETGVETFRSAGKNLYAFPWYLIVGEPGSGKTEAIRHCNIGFPPGLQDEFQGAGGTLNMNWWFTDHAVILDTAGRLMFDEVQTGHSSEWVEFLRLLKKSRGNCPVNGVILAIPADSLIRDTADEIERKASKIARQFDVIQRTLDVRFPVFVVITKSDLITGFRDFFDKLEDPQLQHQILGWSNPSPLDEPYNPGFIEQHLKTIRGRLFRRRLALMRHIAGGDETDAGLGQIDSLYAFPHGLSNLAPRMARYLELIFSVGNQWSGKPLFFRGIYFTSSMQEGSTLDEDLAGALGLPVESLPDGRAWMRDRAYFLRDLFMKKIFQEKGLVTRATNARKQHTRRKAVVMCSGILSVLILIVFTIYTAWGFNSNIGRLENFFSKFTGDIRDSGRLKDIDRLKVVRADDGEYSYGGNTVVTGLDLIKARLTKTDDDDRILKSAYHVELDLAIKTWEEKEGRWWLSRLSGGGIGSDRLRKAQRILYEQTVLIPFVDAARNKLLSDTGGTALKSEAGMIKTLMALKVEKAYSPDSFLDPYMAYISGGEMDNASGVWPDDGDDRQYLHQLLVNADGDVKPPYISLKDAYIRVEDEGDSSLKFKSLWSNWDNIDIAINTGCKHLISQWSDPDNIIRPQDREKLNNLSEIASYFNEYGKAEQALLDLPSPVSGQWAAKFDELQEHKNKIEVWLKDNVETSEMSSLEEKVESVYSDLTDSVKKQFEPLQEMLKLEESNKTTNAVSLMKNAVGEVKDKVSDLSGKKPENKSTSGDYRSTLESAPQEIRNKIEAEKNRQIADYALLDELYWKQSALNREQRPYQERFELYDEVNKLLAQESLDVIEGAVEVLEKIKAQTEKLPPEQKSKDDPETRRDRFAKAMLLCKHSVISHALDSAPRDVDKLYGSIQPDSTPDEIAGQKYDPDTAKKRVDVWRRLEAYISNDFAKEYKQGGTIYQLYIDEYEEYWLGKYPASRVASMIKRQNTWGKQREWLGALSSRIVADELEQLYQKVNAATDVFVATESAVKRSTETVSYTTLRDAFEFWKQPGGRVATGDNYDPLVMRIALLEMSPVGWVDNYCFIGKSERDMLVGMYLSELAKQMIEVLADDVESKREQGIAKVTSLAAQCFPFSRISRRDITTSEISEMHAGMGTLSSSENWERDSIGYGKDVTLVSSLRKPKPGFEEKMLEYVGNRQKDTNTAFKKLRAALQMTSDSVEGKRVNGIRNLLACLPEEDKLDMCNVNVASEALIEESKQSHSINEMYRDFRIRRFRESKSEEVPNWARKDGYGKSVLSEKLPFEWNAFYVEVFMTSDAAPNTAERISQYEKGEILNCPRFGPFWDDFAFLRMIFSDDCSSIQSNDKRKWLVRFSLKYEDDGGIVSEEALYLQLEFTKNGEQVKWPSLSEWPDENQ